MIFVGGNGGGLIPNLDLHQNKTIGPLPGRLIFILLSYFEKIQIREYVYIIHRTSTMFKWIT